jgi:hypothetical protein
LTFSFGQLLLTQATCFYSRIPARCARSGACPRKVYRIAKAIDYRGLSVQKFLEETIVCFNIAAEMKCAAAHDDSTICFSRLFSDE